jgi:hypothetical protein
LSLRSFVASTAAFIEKRGISRLDPATPATAVFPMVSDLRLSTANTWFEAYR